MASSKHLIEEIYDHIARGNLSKVLPVLDEHIRVYVPESLPFGGAYLGRDGYVSMLSKAMQTWQTPIVRPQHYYLPENASDDLLIVSGEFEVTLPGAEATSVFPFVDQWRVRDRTIVELRIFYWDTARLLLDLHRAATGLTSQNSTSAADPESTF
ncbi:nuclear transport factor 2 family protein [Larkinella insperata]|uniref:Nuclear transport factor 2 family protein n=1 Tax=Larkinella insperata TaxID=332158 RepID=A0ABW3QBQ7_9BACT|nr:nuclear transport factor 2 family protein [Larkinella insperata]